MNIEHYLANFFIVFCQPYFFISVFFFGYFFINKKIFFNSAVLMLLSALINYALKVSFKVPLAPLLNKEGFAFPSGHMQVSSAFYGYFLWLLKPFFFRACIAITIVGVGFAIVFFGYHTPFEVLAAVFVSLWVVFLFCFYQYKLSNKHFILAIFVISLCALLYTSLVFSINDQMWANFYVLLGLIFSEYLFNDNKEKNFTIKQKSLAAVFFGLLFSVVFFLIPKTLIINNFLNGAIIPFCFFLSQKIANKKFI